GPRRGSPARGRTRSAARARGRAACRVASTARSAGDRGARPPPSSARCGSRRGGARCRRIADRRETSSVPLVIARDQEGDKEGGEEGREGEAVVLAQRLRAKTRTGQPVAPGRTPRAAREEEVGVLPGIRFVQQARDEPRHHRDDRAGAEPSADADRVFAAGSGELEGQILPAGEEVLLPPPQFERACGEVLLDAAVAAVCPQLGAERRAIGGVLLHPPQGCGERLEIHRTAVVRIDQGEIETLASLVDVRYAR